MDFGAHLPLMDFGGNPYTFEHLADFTDTAARLGFSALAVNDHLVFSVPWLDGPTALAAMVEHSGSMTLATTVSLPIVRGRCRWPRRWPRSTDSAAVGWSSPLAPARRRRTSSASVSTSPSGGPVSTSRLTPSDGVVAVGRCSVCRPFLRHRRGSPRSTPDAPGRTTHLDRELGLGRRVASHRPLGRRLAGVGVQHDPTAVRQRVGSPARALPAHAKDPDTFPNALATMWFFITDDAAEADRVVRQRMVPTIHRPEEVLHDRLPVGPASCSPRSSRHLPVLVSNGSSYGRSTTRPTSSSCSGTKCGRR